MLKQFFLQRDIDESGVSGTGIVAEGVIFPNGKCIMYWNTPTSSMAIYDCLADVKTIHGHGGKTKVMVRVSNYRNVECDEYLKSVLDENYEKFINLLNKESKND